MSEIRSLLSGGLAAAAMAAPTAALADDGKQVNAIGADAALVLPLGDYGDTADFSLGALGRVEIGISSKMWITGRLGLLYDLGTPESFSYLYVPIYGGVKRQLKPWGLFAYGELGLTIIRVSAEIFGETVSDTETEIGLAGGVGFQVGKLQARGGLWFPDLDQAGLMFNVGYDFAAL